MQIEIDISEFKKALESFSERETKKLIKRTVNDILFDVRTFAIKDKKGMAAEFTIRNKALIRKHLKVKKALGVTGYFGSIKSARFSGWTEQQHGTPTKRTIKAHTRNARGPSGRRKIPKKYRRNHAAIKDLSSTAIGNATGSTTQLITANLAMLRRRKERVPVRLPVKFGKMKPGIYNLLKSGKMKMMEVFETKQPKRNQWANDIVLRYIASGKHRAIIEKNIEKVIKDAKR